MKKLKFGLLIVALLLALCPLVPVQANGPLPECVVMPAEIPTISGGSVFVPILLDRGGCFAFDTKLAFNGKVLKNPKFVLGPACTGERYDLTADNANVDPKFTANTWTVVSFSPMEGIYSLCVFHVGATGTTGGGMLGGITFDIAPDAAPGSYSIRFQRADVNEVPFTGFAGSVKVEAPNTPAAVPTNTVIPKPAAAAKATSK